MIDLDPSMLFVILRHLPCTDYMKWNKGELYCYWVWFTMIEDDCLLLELYMCRCKEWLNINLVRSYNTALLKEMRYVYLVSHPFHVCIRTLTRGKVWPCVRYWNHTVSVWMACMCYSALPCIWCCKKQKRGRAYVALHSSLLHTASSETMEVETICNQAYILLEYQYISLW